MIIKPRVDILPARLLSMKLKVLYIFITLGSEMNARDK